MAMATSMAMAMVLAMARRGSAGVLSPVALCHGPVSHSRGHGHGPWAVATATSMAYGHQESISLLVEHASAVVQDGC
jgi:hypothetical protein